MPPERGGPRQETATSTSADNDTAASPWYLTPETYPFAPYPPFRDPQDWQPIDNYQHVSYREKKRAEQLVHDSTQAHFAGDHETSEHPWCQRCYIRFTNAKRTARGDEPVIEGTHEWDEAMLDARLVAVARAGRYLLLHSRPPTDTGPPPSLGVLDDLYLDRAQLDDLPDPQPLIDNIFNRHEYVILNGRDSTFKTFLALDWSLSLATGRTWQGHAVEKGRVLYIAGEGAHGIAARVRAWEKAWHLEVDPDRFTVRTAALNLHKPGPDFDHLLDVITNGEYDLVVIDTLRRVSGTADGNSSDMGAVVDNIERIKRATADGSVLVLAHTAKDDKDSRGFSGIEDDAEVVWHIKRDETHLEVELRKNKDGADQRAIHLEARATHGSLILEGSGPGATKVASTESQVKLVETFQQMFRDGAYSGELLKASGLSESSYHRARAALLAGGHIENAGTSKRPFYVLIGHSHDIPGAEDLADLRNSHDSQQLPLTPTETPTTPTSLKGGSGSQETGEDSPDTPKETAR